MTFIKQNAGRLRSVRSWGALGVAPGARGVGTDRRGPGSNTLRSAPVIFIYDMPLDDDERDK